LKDSLCSCSQISVLNKGITELGFAAFSPAVLCLNAVAQCLKPDRWNDVMLGCDAGVGDLFLCG